MTIYIAYYTFIHRWPWGNNDRVSNSSTMNYLVYIEWDISSTEIALYVYDDNLSWTVYLARNVVAQRSRR